MVIEIVLVYLCYFFLILAGSYYFTLFTSKDVYTRDDFKLVFPFISKFISSINDNYPGATFWSVLLVSSFSGILIPMIITHWITNSSILFIILFFVLPVIKNNHEKFHVTGPETYSDALTGLVYRFSDAIILGYGVGLGTALMYNWRSLSHIYSLFFLLNIIILSIFIGNIVIELIKE